MRILLQRTTKANVIIDNKDNGSINDGLVLFVGFTNNDSETIIDKMIDKVINLRIFSDSNGNMNLSLLDINGSILSISQFTLYADYSHGRRPSFIDALNKEDAYNLYHLFNNKLRSKNIIVEEGIFGSHMDVTLTNSGPVTILLDSKEI